MIRSRMLLMGSIQIDPTRWKIIIMLLLQAKATIPNKKSSGQRNRGHRIIIVLVRPVDNINKKLSKTQNIKSILLRETE